MWPTPSSPPPRSAQLEYESGKPSMRQLRALVPEHGPFQFEFHAGGQRFVFRVMPVGSHYRINIANPIDYRGRPMGSHDTHRIIPGSDLTPYICIKTGHEPRDVPAAACLAIWWAKKTVQYI